MAITAAGVGSGLDIEGIVTQLMQVERQPLVRLQQTESDLNAQLSGYGQLKSAVSSFQEAMQGLGSMDKFRIFSATSSDDSVLTASTTSSAATGIYSVDITRLAQNHKMGSDQFADTATFGGTAGDALNITIGTGSLSVDLSTAQTLSQIRDTINADANNPGVTASIINVGGGQQRLLLNSDEPGFDQRIQLSYVGGSPATLNFQTTNLDTAVANLGNPLASLNDLDASFTIDGFAITSASNSVSGVIDGITLQLETVGKADLSIERDTAAIEESAQELVDAYNNLNDTINSLSDGALSGDSTLRSLQGLLRNELNTAPVGLTGLFDALSQVGITSDAKTGELQFNSTDFSDALNTDFTGVAELFAHDDQGFAFRFDALASSVLDTDGLIDAREDGLQSRLDSNENAQLRMEDNLDLKEVQLRARFAALDGLLGSLQATSSFLTQQLSGGNG